MSDKPILIIHGWSDHADSFERLGELIQTHTKRSIQLIDLANYVSLDDSVTMADLITAMDRAWDAQGLSREPRSVDAIVHSTGGLIIRAWLSRYFEKSVTPIHHLVMLAPANFGSPLAQKGRALIGRIIAGFHSPHLFQTGEHILKALELASPFSWDLAMRDRFGSNDFYGPGKILCTVLIGNRGYRGIRAAANEPGMDGVVRQSTANLNCAYCVVDFTRDQKNPTIEYKTSLGQTAFGIMNDEDHSSIVAKNEGPRNSDTLTNILTALDITDDGFDEWCRQLAHENIAAAHSSFQTTVKYLDDQYQHSVDDYFLEFYAEPKDNDSLSEFFHEKVIHSVHTYHPEPAYRSLFIDLSHWKDAIKQGYDRLSMSLTALPAFTDNQLVGYRSYDKNHFGALELSGEWLEKLLQPNRTLFTKIKIPRMQALDLFTIRSL